LIAVVFLVVAIVVGFVLLLLHSLRERNPVEVLLFSILHVLMGMSLVIIDSSSHIAYAGLFCSFFGFLIGVIHFLQQGKKMSENK